MLNMDISLTKTALFGKKLKKSLEFYLLPYSNKSDESAWNFGMLCKEVQYSRMYIVE